MKSAIFRKNGEGVLVGRLSAPDRIRCDQNGKIEEFELSGNVVETEYNDVLVVGKKTDEHAVFVQQMESLPTAEDGALLFTFGEQNDACCVAIPKSCVKEIADKVAANGAPYKAIRAEIGKNHSFYLNLYDRFEEESVTDTIVALLKSAPQRTENRFGEGYAVKTVITESALGWQIKS